MYKYDTALTTNVIGTYAIYREQDSSLIYLCMYERDKQRCSTDAEWLHSRTKKVVMS